MPPCQATCSLTRCCRSTPGTSGRGGAGRFLVSGFTARFRPSGFSPLRLKAPRSVSFVAAFGSAPRARSSLTASTRPVAAAKISGVWRRSFSCALIAAPLSRSVVMAATSPAAAANISGVAPVFVLASTGAPAATSACAIGRRSALGREVQRRVGAELRRRARVRAGGDQRRDQFRVAVTRRPVQRGDAVALRRVHVGALLDHREHVRAIAAHRRVGDGRRPSRTTDGAAVRLRVASEVGSCS